jgi:hypothetical protein
MTMKISCTEVDEVFRSVMDLTLRLQADELKSAAGVEGLPQMVRAEISFKGAWKGQVMLQIEPALAREMAALMMCKDPEETADTETFDAVGELANIIAGNLRPLMPGYRAMTLPRVTQEELRTMPKADFPLELSYLLDGRSLSIAVAESHN